MRWLTRHPGCRSSRSSGRQARRPIGALCCAGRRPKVVRCTRRRSPSSASGRRISLGTVVEGSLTVRSLRGVLAASVCLLAVPVALLVQLIVGSGAELVLHLVGGVGCLLTAFAVFDFEPPRWLPWVGCLSIGAFGVTFLLQGISQLLRHRLAHIPGVSNPRATARRIVGRRFLGVV